MSEVYNFTPLSEVETQESATDTTKILAVDNGTVKQIPASAVGGSGGGSFIVETKFDETMQIISADKTYAEIVAASQNGCVPFVRCTAVESIGDDGAFFLPLAMASTTEGTLMFCGFIMEGFVAAVCMSDDTWVLQVTG